ncbi:MAG: hypothetical protein WC112_10005 [Proteiniphilum sp.]
MQIPDNAAYRVNRSSDLVDSLQVARSRPNGLDPSLYPSETDNRAGSPSNSR